MPNGGDREAQKKINIMKKFFFLAFVPMLLGITVLSSCSEDANNVILEDFDYPEDILFGTWEAVRLDGEAWPSTYPTTTATFYEDGTYSGKGAYGRGSGTYAASGKTIKCYVGGDLYCKYDVLELSGSRAKMRMTMGSQKYELICKKL